MDNRRVDDIIEEKKEELKREYEIKTENIMMISFSVFVFMIYLMILMQLS